MELAAEAVVLPSSTGGLRIGPAKISIDGSTIADVVTCDAKDWPATLKLWQEKNPELQVFRDKLISPVFINAHTHLAMNLFRSLDTLKAARENMVEDLFFAVEARLQADDVRAFARLGAYENLLAGVGLVWDHYYHGLALAEGISDTGLAAVVAPTLQDLAGPGKDAWEREWGNTVAIHQSQALRAKGIFAAWGPHATDTVSADLWQKIAQAADKLSLPIHSHLAQSREEYQRCLEREHCSPVSWLERLGVLAQSPSSLLVHSIFVGREDLAILAKYRVSLGFCPYSALIFAFPAPIADWQARGLPWVLGTDCVASNSSMNLQKELRLVAGLSMAGFNERAAYRDFFAASGSQNGGIESHLLQNLARLGEQRRQVWDQGARLRQPEFLLSRVWQAPGGLHPQLRVGTLAAGQLASLIVWDTADPSFWPGCGFSALAMGDTTTAIHHLLSAGKWLGEAGNFHASIKQSPTYRAHLHEAQQRFHAVLKRCGLN